jgi:hypothetical protein
VKEIEGEKRMSQTVRHFRDLDVYRMAMETTVEIFEMTKVFPAEERYSLTDQVRRNSRSVSFALQTLAKS